MLDKHDLRIQQNGNMNIMVNLTDETIKIFIIVIIIV